MRILVPTDFGELSEWALELAQKIHRQTPSQIELLHLVQAPAGVLLDGRGQVIDDGEIDLSAYRSAVARGQSQMDEWAQKYEVQGAVQCGGLTTGIVRAVDEFGSDLVVMGTAGNGGLKELLSRSEAGEVALQSPVPVLSLKCDRSDLRVRNALVIGEFPSARKRPLDAVKALVDHDQGRWHLMAINASDTDACDSRQERMARFAEVNELGDVQLHFHRNGDPEMAIAQILQEQEIDVLCIAVRRKNLGSWLRGDLALALVHHFHKPIFTYPAED